jgi:hypothetical protein
MKKLISNKPFVILLAVFISTVFYFVYEASEAYVSHDIPMSSNCIKTNSYSILQSLHESDSNNILKTFDYRLFLEKSNYCNYSDISNNIEIIDSIYGNFNEITEPLFYNLLGDTLINSYGELKTFNPTFILKKLNWIRSLKYYAEFNNKHYFIYMGVYDRWFQKITQLLSNELELNSNLKYNNNFKIIAAQCKLEGYYIPQKLNSKEKLINYLVEGKFSYIWNRIWNNTNFITKIILLLFISGSIYSICFTSAFIIKKINNKK